MKKRQKKPAVAVNTPENEPLSFAKHDIFAPEETILSKREAIQRKDLPIRPFYEGLDMENLSMIDWIMLKRELPPPEYYNLKNVLRAIRRRVILMIGQRYRLDDIRSEEISTDYNVGSEEGIHELRKDLKMEPSIIKLDPEKAEKDIKLLVAFISICTALEHIIASGETTAPTSVEERLLELLEISDKVGYCIYMAYELGEHVMLERLRGHAQRIYTGPKPNDKALYWGKAMDNTFNSLDKDIPEKTRKTMTYNLIRKRWKKEIPDTESNPAPSVDTLKKYWDSYLKQKK